MKKESNKDQKGEGGSSNNTKSVLQITISLGKVEESVRDGERDVTKEHGNERRLGDGPNI